MSTFNEKNSGSEEMSKGMTGSTGNVGQTGGPAITQESGNTGRVTKTPEELLKQSYRVSDNFDHTLVNSLENKNISGEEFAKSLMFQELHGHTGGIGGIPEDYKEAASNFSISDMMHTMNASFKDMDEKDLLKNLESQNIRFEEVMGKVNNVAVVLSIRMGLIVNKLKEKRAAHNDWTEWSKKNILKPFKISKRSLEKWSNIALLPNIESYTYLGIEILADFGSSLKALSVEDKAVLGDDPIKHYLEKLDKEASEAERREHFEAVNEVQKLQKLEVIIGLELMKDYLANSGTFSKDKRKELAQMKKDHGDTSVVEFLKQVIANAGNWDKAKGVTPETVAKSKESDTSDSKTKVSIPNMKVQITTLRKSLKTMIASGEDFEGITPEEVNELIADLVSMKEKLSNKLDKTA